MRYSYSFKDPIDETDLCNIQKWIASKDYSDKSVLSTWGEVIQFNQNRTYSLVFYKTTPSETEVYIERSQLCTQQNNS